MSHSGKEKRQKVFGELFGPGVKSLEAVEASRAPNGLTWPSEPLLRKCVAGLNDAQRSAFNRIVLEGESIFVTGGAGTGKSRLLHAVRKALYLKYEIRRMNSPTPSSKRGSAAAAAQEPSVQPSEKQLERAVDSMWGGVPEVAVVAPSGCAAVLVRGQTVAAWSGVGFLSGAEPEHDDEFLARLSSDVRGRWRRCDVLIVDEISMVSARLFDLLDKCGRYYRNEPLLPFGGVQVVCFGDFYQLPPVPERSAAQIGRYSALAQRQFNAAAQKKGMGGAAAASQDAPAPVVSRRTAKNASTASSSSSSSSSDGDERRLAERVEDARRFLSAVRPEYPKSYSQLFAFYSAVWRTMYRVPERIVYLRQVYRQQDDAAFTELLGRLRIGATTPADTASLRGRLNARMPLCEETGVEPTRLYAKRDSVEKANRTSLEALPPETRHVYAANYSLYCIRPASPIRREQDIISLMQRSERVCDALELREGAQVMLTSNLMLDASLCNGARGVVTRFVSPEEAISMWRTSNAAWQRSRAEGIFPPPISACRTPYAYAYYTGSLSEDSFKYDEDSEELLVRRGEQCLLRDASTGKVVWSPSSAASPDDGAVEPPRRSGTIKSFNIIDEETSKKRQLPPPLDGFRVPVVRFIGSKGAERAILPVAHTISGEKWKGVAFQLPLALAWASTIHKSQGMSLEAAEIDLCTIFGPHMAYVAVSRVTSLEGLRLVNTFNAHKFAVAPEVKYYYAHIEQAIEARRIELSAQVDEALLYETKEIEPSSAAASEDGVGGDNETERGYGDF